MFELFDVYKVCFEEVAMLVLHFQDFHCIDVAGDSMDAALDYSVGSLPQHLKSLEGLVEGFQVFLWLFGKLLSYSYLPTRKRNSFNSFIDS